MTNSAPADDPRPTGARDGQTTESARTTVVTRYDCKVHAKNRSSDYGIPTTVYADSRQQAVDRAVAVAWNGRATDARVTFLRVIQEVVVLPITPEQHVDRHEHDGSGCIECACNAAPWSANDCTCPGGFS